MKRKSPQPSKQKENNYLLSNTVVCSLQSAMLLLGVSCLMAAWSVLPPPAMAFEEVILQDLSGDGVGARVFRLTDTPGIREHANYHNTDCWSPTGRYVCYTRYGVEEEVYVYDLKLRKEIKVDTGRHPRWANKHDWLLYVQKNKFGGDPRAGGTLVMRYDVATGKSERISYGIQFLGSVDREDRWVFGSTEDDKVGWVAVRAPLVPKSKPEVIYSRTRCLRPLCNPGHDLLSCRDKSGGDFDPSRLWMDLDGSNPRNGVPNVQSGHMSWSGDGEYQLVGNYQARGRKWNEPFPSNLHLLANGHLSDASPCGKSGRWINSGATVADLRSGDTRRFSIPPSNIAFPKGTGDVSEITDSDAKGSPDGTKIGFVHTMDLATASYTLIRTNLSSGDKLEVASTAGFPESGELEIRGEVIGYGSKTDSAFMQLERGRYDTGMHRTLSNGWRVVDFGDRIIPVEKRKTAVLPGWWDDKMSRFGNQDFYWQRQTDVYVLVVRSPDPPHLRVKDGRVELLPGENHFETKGYVVFQDGTPINTEPLKPGQAFRLPGAGTYTALAIEWSGLESTQSLPLVLSKAAGLTILKDQPDDFAWTEDAWIVGGNEVPVTQAKSAAKSILEKRHLIDGIIRREHYENGVIIAAEDLNAEGFAARRLEYKDGRLFKREYFDDGGRVSLELFGDEGFKTHEYRYVNSNGKEYEKHQWVFDKGWPTRYEYERGKRVFEKQGLEWRPAG